MEGLPAQQIGNSVHLPSRDIIPSHVTVNLRRKSAMPQLRMKKPKLPGLLPWHRMDVIIHLRKPWMPFRLCANASGFRSEWLKEQPCFYQQAAEFIEGSWFILFMSGTLWSMELLGSNLPDWAFDNTGWDTGVGDTWLRMEAWRTRLFRLQLIVLCKDAK